MLFRLNICSVSTEDDANADGSQEKQDSGNMAFLNPDLLVLGFQELDLSTEGLIYSTRTDKADAWCAAILAGLGDHAEDYEKVCGMSLFIETMPPDTGFQLVSKQLVGMLIVIFVKKTLKGCFSDIKTASAGTGVMGLMVNMTRTPTCRLGLILCCRETKVVPPSDWRTHLHRRTRSRIVYQHTLAS